MFVRADPDHVAAMKRDGFGWEAGGRLWIPMKRVPWWRRRRRKTMAKLEHINFTASDPKSTAELLCRLFDWRIRWQGKALAGGYTVHVGDDGGYLAIYTPQDSAKPGKDTYHQTGGLNHIGVVVSDLKKTEGRVKAEGFQPHNHADYDPGQRFYFDGPDGIEYEVVSYS